MSAWAENKFPLYLSMHPYFFYDWYHSYVCIVNKKI